jgi:hypothetical protein
MITMRSAWLGKIRQHRQGDSPREAVETLASGKKLWLIAKMNPQWRDLAADWYETQGLSTGQPVRCGRVASLEMTVLWVS